MIRPPFFFLLCERSEAHRAQRNECECPLHICKANMTLSQCFHSSSDHTKVGIKSFSPLSMSKF